jgi:hypothetical protein
MASKGTRQTFLVLSKETDLLQRNNLGVHDRETRPDVVYHLILVGRVVRIGSTRFIVRYFLCF